MAVVSSPGTRYNEFWKMESGTELPGKHPAPPESAQGAIFDGAFFVRRVRRAAFRRPREGWVA